MIVPPAQTGRCGCTVTGGASLKPSALRKKKKYFRKHNGSEIASELEMWMKEKQTL